MGGKGGGDLSPGPFRPNQGKVTIVFYFKNEDGPSIYLLQSMISSSIYYDITE